MVYDECVDSCDTERCEFECGWAFVEDLKSCPCYESPVSIEFARHVQTEPSVPLDSQENHDSSGA